MPKKSLIYSDLSKKQLDNLKEIYIQQKVSSMSNKELKNFVLQIITHQITDTIDKEEETEAWREMSDFFDDKFEAIAGHGNCLSLLLCWYRMILFCIKPRLQPGASPAAFACGTGVPRKLSNGVRAATPLFGA